MSQSLVAVVSEGEPCAGNEIEIDIFIRPAEFSDAFCLFYNAATKTVQALNGSGHSPAKLTIDYVRQQGVEGVNIPATNLNSVTVPGRSGLFISGRRHTDTKSRCRSCLGRYGRTIRER